MAVRRIVKEAKDLEAFMRRTVDAVGEDAPEPVLSRQIQSVAVNPEDPYYWTVTVVPTVDTCMSEALFGVEVTLCVRFPQDYPFKPFAVTFDDAWLEGVRKGSQKQAQQQHQRFSTSKQRTVRFTENHQAPTGAPIAEAERQLKRRALIDAEGSGRTVIEKEWRAEATAIAASLLPPVPSSTSSSIPLTAAAGAAPPPEEEFPPSAAYAATLLFAESSSAAAASQPQLDLPAPPAAAAAVAAVAPAPPAATVGPNEPIRISVQTLSSRVFTIEHLTPSSTTDALRSAIDEREGALGYRIALSHLDRLIRSGRTLADYGVRRDTTIHLVLAPLETRCESSLLGAEGILRSDWAPMFTISKLLRTLNESLFAAVPPANDLVCPCRRQLRYLLETHATLDLVQWAARCSSPARGVVWSPSNDARWPLLFRKIVRYVRRIGVRAESHATRRTLPLDVVERIASYL